MTDSTAKALTLAESINIAAVADLQVALSNLLENPDAAIVEVDCSMVRSIDAAAGKQLRLARPSEDFLRIAGYVGLVDALAAA